MGAHTRYISNRRLRQADCQEFQARYETLTQNKTKTDNKNL